MAEADPVHTLPVHLRDTGSSNVRYREQCMQVALGIGCSMFLVDPDNEKVKDFEVFEPEEATCEPINPEAAEGPKGAAGKGKGAKRKAEAPAAKKPRGKK